MANILFPQLNHACLMHYYELVIHSKAYIFLTFEVILLLQLHILSFSFRRNKELTAESVKHLEKVFRENLAKDKDEFTLSEFKKIVPSKNVSYSNAGFPFSCSLNTFYSFSLWVLIDANERALLRSALLSWDAISGISHTVADFCRLGMLKSLETLKILMFRAVDKQQTCMP